MKGPTAKARIDADRTCRPMTEIVGHAQSGHCVGPYMSTLSRIEVRPTRCKKHEDCSTCVDLGRACQVSE